MNFKMKYNIYAEARAVLAMKSPLLTFKACSIGEFVLAWSGTGATTAVRGTLVGFGCDSQGEYAMVKLWTSDCVCRYTLVAPLPPELMPERPVEGTETIWRDPDVKQPELPL